MATAENDKPITALLDGMLQGDARQRDQLFEVVYSELRRIARKLMATERAGHTWQATELAHELYLRLVPGENLGWVSRRAFYSVVATNMKRLLAEHARNKRTLKRGEEFTVALDATDLNDPTSREEYEYLELHDELSTLREINETTAEIVDLRLFAGLSVAEVSACLGVPLRSVERHLDVARGWLRSRGNRHERP